MSPSNLNNVACVIDTECTYISRTPRMVYHFGATIGNLDNENQFDVITMDYYVKEIIENIGMFLHTNSKGNDYSYNKNMAHSWKDAINNPHKVKSWKSIIKEWKKLMKIHNVSYLTSYNFNFETNPISLGTTIAFLDNAGKYTRFFEMQAVLREGEPNVLEQSKNISKLFPNDIDLIANSRENSTIFFATKGTNKLYGFRYYQTGERRVQQAWFEWELSGTIEHIAMLDDALYAVVKNTGYTMQKFSLKLDDNSHTIVEDETYRVHLDNSKSFAYTNLTYVADGDYTKFDHTAADFSGSGQLYAVAVSTSTDKEFNGLVSKVTTFDDNGTTKVKIPSNWTTSTASQAFNVVLGYAFDMEIEFPTLYVTQQEGERFKSDIQSSLVLHRIKMSLGPTGVYDTTLKRIGKPDYTETFESILADAYTANTVGIDKEQVVTLPVYEKNTNLTFTLKSTHPTPSTLYSINWEGDYSKRYYKRV